MMTTKQIAKATKDFTKIAGEPVRAEQIGSCFYIFASELGVLRVFYKYRHVSSARAEFSSNFKSWYFVMEVSV